MESTNDGCKGLYTYRKLNTHSLEYLYDWMNENRIPNRIPSDKLHCTVVCSESSLPNYSIDPLAVLINPATFKIELMNEALTLSFESVPLKNQWLLAKNLGASFKYPSYRPHISLSYAVPLQYDYSQLKPPYIPLILDPEISGELVKDWKKTQNLK